MLRISDKYGSGTVLLCEFHFNRLQKYIDVAKAQAITVTSYSVKTRGCRSCLSDKIGFSKWSGSMFPIWRGFKESESR